jgi:hypothetical protein
MINKNLKNGDTIAIRLRKHNTFIGYDAGFIDNIRIATMPVFWWYHEDFTLETYLPLKIQKELYEKYGIDVIEVQKELLAIKKTNRTKYSSEVMMVQQYYIDPIKKNLGIIEFIRVKHSDF